MANPVASTSQSPISVTSNPSISVAAHVAPAPPGGQGKGKRRADDDDGEEDGGKDDGNAKGKKRNRKPVTRKLKCDRGYPCGACRDRQEGHLCEWEGAIRLPQPHLTRDAEAQELRLQLDRLESLLGAFSGNPAALAAVAAAGVGGTPNGEGVAEKSAAEALGLLAANPPGSSSKIVPSARAQLLAAGGGNVSHLITLLPVKKELEALISRFLMSELLFFPIVHVPTFNARVGAYTNATAPEQPFFLAVLLAIAGFEMGWQLTEPGLSRVAGIEKENAAKRFLEASLEALRMGNYLETPELDVVRALLVLYRCAEQQLDSRGGFFLSQAVQVAQTLGLNRDPGNVEGFSRIEVEERRKLWHVLVGLDWLDQSNRLSTITTTQYDTQEPANAFDVDVTEEGVTARPFPTFTPTLFFHLLNQIATYSHAISEEVYGVKPHSPLLLQRVDELNAGLELLKRKLPILEFSGDTVKAMGEEQVLADRFRVQAHSAILELTIRLNRPFVTRGLADSRLKVGREKCLDAAHKLLGIWLGYPEKHPISRLQSVFFHALNAMLLCAIDLFQDSQSAHVEKNRRLIAAISMKLNAREHRPKIVAEVVRVVGVLIRSATKAAENRPASISVDASAFPLPADFTFSRPFPLPMTRDPFSLLSAPTPPGAHDPDLLPLFDSLTEGYKLVYAVPDRREWEELAKTTMPLGGRPWENGVDLLGPSA
ncbi:hypothetical protein JCM10213_002492 [Rhodosporidiobolus nylandii]